ncbi:unnamed protein product, partial [Rotaria sp. Silwood2]
IFSEITNNLTNELCHHIEETDLVINEFL